MTLKVACIFIESPSDPGSISAQSFHLSRPNDSFTPNLLGMRISDICLGDAHTCALRDDGKVKCFGNNASGQLGIGTNENHGDQPDEMGSNLAFVDYGTGIEPTGLICGRLHTCLRFSTNQTKCWGGNSHGQLVVGDTTSRGSQQSHMGDNLPFSNWGTNRTVKQFTAGDDFSCAILDNDTVKCAGDNANGQLGYGDKTHRGGNAGTIGDNLPVIDFGNSGFPIRLSKGSLAWHTCIILEQGLKCWGRNEFGKLGLGDQSDEMGNRLPFVDIGTNRTAVEVAVGRDHTCAICDDGSVVCWGLGAYGQLARGPTESLGYDVGDEASEMGDALVPMQLGAGKKAREISLGWYSSCVIIDVDNSVKCFGPSQNGQTGQETLTNIGDSESTIGDNLPPIDFGTDLPIGIVGSSNTHSCVVFKDSIRIKCWGGGGVLGLGDLQARGANEDEMGEFLPFVDLFETLAPTRSPVPAPTGSPLRPTVGPTGSPTHSPSTRPSLSPTPPTTLNPTHSPTTLAPSTSPTASPSSVPVTKEPSESPSSATPTDSPTVEVFPHEPPKKECISLTNPTACGQESDSACGQCAYVPDKPIYSFNVNVTFTMDGNRKFADLEETFMEAVRQLMKKGVQGLGGMSVRRIGAINQTESRVNGRTVWAREGFAIYRLSFNEKESDKAKSKAFLALQSSNKEYMDDLNAALKKAGELTRFLVGSFKLKLDSVDPENTTGTCVCGDLASSAVASYRVSSEWWMILWSLMLAKFCAI